MDGFSARSSPSIYESISYDALGEESEPQHSMEKRLAAFPAGNCVLPEVSGRLLLAGIASLVLIAVQTGQEPVEWTDEEE